MPHRLQFHVPSRCTALLLPKLAAPFAADLDGDGVWDLAVGEFGGGGCRLYKNVGTAKEPKFGSFTMLLSDGKPMVVEMAAAGLRWGSGVTVGWGCELAGFGWSEPLFVSPVPRHARNRAAPQPNFRSPSSPSSKTELCRLLGSAGCNRRDHGTTRKDGLLTCIWWIAS